MFEILVPFAIFLCLVAAGLGSVAVSKRLHPRHRDDDTSNVVRLAANVFVVMTSLVLGLLLNSARSAIEAVDRNVHSFATELVLLDRSLRRQGPDSDEIRQRLAAYTRQAIEGTWPSRGTPVLEDRTAERLLDQVGSALVAMRPADPARVELWREAEVNYQNVLKRRWILIEESEGAIPTPFLVVVVAWLVLIFASFGYRAPNNAVVGTTLVASAFLIAAAIYLILDMGAPFSGPIQISPAPLQRAAEQMSR